MIRCHRSKVRTVAALAVVPLLLAACSSDTGEPDSLSGDLPASLQGGDLAAPVIIYPPYGSQTDSGELEGLIVDMGSAIAAELGVEVEQREDVWENMLTGVQSGNYVWTFGAEINAERLEAFDFTLLNNVYTTFLVMPDAPDLPAEPEALCGLTISAVAGAVQAQKLGDMSVDVCQANGLDPISVDEYKDLAAAYLAVESGNADAQALVYPAAANILNTDPDARKITGPEILASIEGIASQKGSGTAEAVTAAVNVLIENGTYAEIMERWGMSDLMVEQSETNPEPVHED